MKPQLSRLVVTLVIVLPTLVMVLSACGGGGSHQSNNSNSGSSNAVNLPPTVSSITPTTVQAGSPGFTLTVNGTNFITGALVHWLSAAGFIGFPATPTSLSQLSVQIPAAEIAIPGTIQVSVQTPNLSGTPVSNVVTLTVTPGPPGVMKTITTGVNGAVPNGPSHDPALSFDGRFIAFSSEATNLVTPNTNFAEAYVRDTCLGADPPPAPGSFGCTPSTLLVSAITGGLGSKPMEGNSLGGATPSMGSQLFSPPTSSNFQGRFIAFLSTATNLVVPSTTFQQVFVRDTCLGIDPTPPPGVQCTPITVLASVTQSGTEPNGAASELMFASNVSCNVAFVSAGTNLVVGVTTPNEVYLSTCTPNGLGGGFKASATLVSASGAGIAGDQGGGQPAISADGRFVAFASTSTNLTSTANGGMQQIYLRDTCALVSTGCSAATTLISVDSSGNLLQGASQVPSISDDGRFVVFNTQIPLSMGGVTNLVSIRDTCTSSSGPVASCMPSTNTVSLAADGSAANGPSSSSRHAVSGDGRFVVFSSSATNLVAGGNPANQVFVRDTCRASSGNVSNCTPRTVLISIDSTRTAVGGFNAAISNDGHSAAFELESGSTTQILLAATGF